tara:strand:- start:7 stop:594 length:588 start_codon:yes stop_codon:yes gene_type:complete
MAQVQEVNTAQLLELIKGELKKTESIKAPVWAKFVKTGAGRDRPPVELDWWHTRASSILRWVYLRGPVGVNKLRVKYGNRANMGMAPERFVKSSGNIIRKILQQLEKAELIKQDTIKGHKGRVVTTKGKSMLDKLSTTISKLKPRVDAQPAPKEKPVDKPKEKPKVEAPKKPADKPKEKKKEESKKPEPKQEPKK